MAQPGQDHVRDPFRLGAGEGAQAATDVQVHRPGQQLGGRIALVGDAAHCAALLSGRGTSPALSGAHFLAEELDEAADDHTAAFERYEQRRRPYVEFALTHVTDGGELIVPSTQEAPMSFVGRAGLPGRTPSSH
ncbi:hypothetical protein [Streptomyces sp. NPDC050548]|uniref:hypothetical protein n=1 Tax=Streptomyces sp. NPDC050548 TaxID=3365629 RepID=UPI0037A22572